MSQRLLKTNTVQQNTMQMNQLKLNAKGLDNKSVTNAENTYPRYPDVSGSMSEVRATGRHHKSQTCGSAKSRQPITHNS
jgi:hypothetical protein